MKRLRHLGLVFTFVCLLGTPSVSFAGKVDLAVMPSSMDAAEIRFAGMKKLMESKNKDRELIILVHEIDEDPMGKALLAYAAKLADAGVKVRIGVDAHSSIMTRGVVEELVKHGIEFKAFRPFSLPNLLKKPGELLLNAAKANRRIHEKIFYIRDGEDASVIMGSRNYTREYFRMFRKPESDEKKKAAAEARAKGKKIKQERGFSFNDTEIMLSGKSEDFEDVVHFVDEKMQHKGMVSKVRKMGFPPSPKGADYAREFAEYQARVDEVLTARAATKSPIPDRDIIRGDVNSREVSFIFDRMGEKAKWQANNNELVDMIRESKKTVLINNPYIITKKGEPLYDELMAALKRGVKVVIKTNAIGESDHDLPSIAFKTIVKDLAEAGAEIYGQATPNALHEKMMIVDAGTPDGKVYIGSANMDPRSMHLNSESGVVVRDMEFSKAVSKFYEDELQEINQWAGPRSCDEGFARIFVGTGYKLGRAPTFKERLSEGWTRFLVKLPFVRNQY